jgi:hypothetical protein
MQVNEQCVQYGECDLFTPFIDTGKPVFRIEYQSDAPDVSSSVKAVNCDVAAASEFASVLKTIGLDAWIDTCYGEGILIRVNCILGVR